MFLRPAGSFCSTTKPGMPSGGDLQGPQEESSGVWLRAQPIPRVTFHCGKITNCLDETALLGIK